MGDFDFSHFTHDWLAAFSVVLLTFLLAGGIRSLLKRAAQKPQWRILEELAPSLANLIYIVGLRILIEVIPLQPKLVLWLDHISYVLAVLILLWLARRALVVAIEWSALKSMPSRTLQQGFIPLMRNVVTLFIFASGGIMVLKHFNYDVMSLVTALGVGSLAVGLAAKDTLSNMISGFTLIIDRNLSPGDTINLGGSLGDVDEIGLRSTRIRTTDGNMLVVPNNDLVNTKLLNLSLRSSACACSLQLRVPFSVPFEKIQHVCAEVLGQTEGVRKDLGNGVLLSSLADGHQLITIYFSVNSFGAQGGVVSEVNRRLISEFTRKEIPLISRNTWL